MLNVTDDPQGKTHPVFALIAESDRLARQSDELLKLTALLDEGVTQSLGMANGFLSPQHSQTATCFAH